MKLARCFIILIVVSLVLGHSTETQIANLEANSRILEAKEDYSIVIGREDKHKIVRYDANSGIFSKLYNKETNPAALRGGSWSINFKTFIAPSYMPSACAHLFAKKKFYANIVLEVHGSCQYWEFNQGHIYHLENTKSQVEEIYTFKYEHGGKRLCVKFTNKETGEGVSSTSDIKSEVGHPDCEMMIKFRLGDTKY